MQCRNVLGHLILLGSELFYAATHDVEIGCQGPKLLHRVKGSCSHGWRPIIPVPGLVQAIRSSPTGKVCPHKLDGALKSSCRTGYGPQPPLSASGSFASFCASDPA